MTMQVVGINDQGIFFGWFFLLRHSFFKQKLWTMVQLSKPVSLIHQERAFPDTLINQHNKDEHTITCLFSPV